MNIKISIATTVVVIFSLALFSCHENEPTRTYHPIIVGDTSTLQTSSVAGYWEDDKFVQLTDGTKHADAFGVAISGSDLYIVGNHDQELSIQVLQYWKNGTPVILPTQATVQPIGISVSNGNVYVGGFDGKDLTVWKNGVPSIVDIGGFGAKVYAMTSSGDDVYFAGSVDNNNRTAAIWKNGIKTELSSGSDTLWSSAQSITVHENDVYAGGFLSVPYPERKIAAYWKNGSLVKPTGKNDPKSSAFGQMAISGSDVYAIDFDNHGYWKNNDFISLPLLAVISIAVTGNDVYVCGLESDHQAAYCKNGKIVRLPGGFAGNFASGIVLK